MGVKTRHIWRQHCSAITCLCVVQKGRSLSVGWAEPHGGDFQPQRRLLRLHDEVQESKVQESWAFCSAARIISRNQCVSPQSHNTRVVLETCTARAVAGSQDGEVLTNEFSVEVPEEARDEPEHATRKGPPALPALLARFGGSTSSTSDTRKLSAS